MGNPSRQRGVTLIEACIVIAIAGGVAGAAIPGLQGVLEARRLGGAATLLATDIQFARSEAVARNRPIRLSFHAHADATCYVIHTGSAAQCDCDGPGAAVCSGDAEQIRTVRLATAEQVSLSANVASILFDPLHGTSSPAATLRLAGPRGREVHHVVNIMGRVRSCTPLGAVTGYRTC